MSADTDAKSLRSRKMPVEVTHMERAKGIDVSHWKPIKDMAAVWDSGVRFVGIKASEGPTYVDPSFRKHREEVRMTPMSLVIYYHFARTGSAGKQAERFMDATGDLRNNERLCLDLEVSPTPNPNDALAWVEDFYEELMQGACSDRRPMIYTSKRIWRTIGDPDWAMASEVDLWSPRYNAQGVEPDLPKPWQDIGWKIWQWTDGAFPEHVTPGVGKCDGNVFAGDDQALAAFGSLGTKPVSSPIS